MACGKKPLEMLNSKNEINHSLQTLFNSSHFIPFSQSLLLIEEHDEVVLVVDVVVDVDVREANGERDGKLS